jgi:chromosome partitioning protein
MLILNASSGLGIDVDSVEIGTYQILEHSSPKTIVKCCSNVDVIPAIDLVCNRNRLVTKKIEYMLKKALADIKEEYDFIIIDCAPSLGLLTLNALTAADSYTIQCEYLH